MELNSAKVKTLAIILITFCSLAGVANGATVSGQFYFTDTYTSVTEGEFFEYDGGSFFATMQSQRDEIVGDTETYLEPITIDTNALTYTIFGYAGNFVVGSSPQEYEFAFTIEESENLNEFDSEDVDFSGMSIWAVSGIYDAGAGTIDAMFTDIYELSWNLTSEVSMSTVQGMIFSNLQPIPEPSSALLIGLVGIGFVLRRFRR